jgi:hypothetical protein
VPGPRRIDGLGTVTERDFCTRFEGVVGELVGG